MQISRIINGVGINKWFDGFSVKYEIYTYTFNSFTSYCRNSSEIRNRIHRGTTHCLAGFP